MRFTIAASVLLAVGVPSIAAEPAKKPNIVFILADDLGRHDCGFMGGTEIKTPHLDKLAAAGTKLDAFYVQPVCSPTRAAFMTGRYPMRHGLQVGVVRPWAQYGLPLDERTLPQALREAGYATSICGKWHLGHFSPEYLPTRRGFDEQYGHYNGALDYFTHVRDGGFDWHRDDKECRDQGYTTHLIAKEAVKFVADMAGRKPFFLYVPFNAVHAPHQAPEKYMEPYTTLKGERKKYAGMLAAMDEAVGQIVAAVEKAGVRGDTLFIFSSDNGGPQPGVVTDNGKFRAGKGTLYEGGVRVCAFATWDGKLKAGATVTEPLHAVDLYPTLLKLIGAKGEQKLPLDGKDAWATIAEGKPSPHSDILLNTTPNNGAIRAGDWKLIVNRGGKDDPDDPVARKGKEQVELINLKDDPYEKTNLAGQYPERVKELRAKLDEYAKQAVPPKARPKPKDFVSPKVWGEKN
jgi:arylsulfatase A-like enzyme